MSREAMKLALEILKAAYVPADLDKQRERAITALEAELAKPDLWEGYVPEPVKPAQQALDKKAENARELGLDYEPAQQESVNQRAYEIALRQWDHWKTYALMLQAKLVKYEGGSPMVLNTSPPAQRKPLTDEEWQSIADTLDCSITRGQKDAIEAALGIKENT